MKIEARVEARRAARKRWKLSHPEAAMAIRKRATKKWRSANPEKILEYARGQRLRRKLKKAAESK